MKPRFLSVLVAALTTTFVAAPAWAEDWTVLSLTEPVKVSRAGQWIQLRPGMVVRHGAWLKTGTKGAVTLQRDGTKVEVKPRTTIAVAGLRDDPDMTVVLQRWGAVTLDVEKRDRPHVKVHTPFMAAVVKGTTLDVTVGREHTDLDVRSGQVEVEDRARGAAADVSAGQRASAGAGRRGSLSLAGGGTLGTVRTVEPKRALVAPVARSRPLTPETASAPAGARLREEVTGWSLRSDARAVGPIEPAVSIDAGLRGGLSDGSVNGARASDRAAKGASDGRRSDEAGRGGGKGRGKSAGRGGGHGKGGSKDRGKSGGKSADKESRGQSKADRSKSSRSRSSSGKGTGRGNGRGGGKGRNR